MTSRRKNHISHSDSNDEGEEGLRVGEFLVSIGAMTEEQVEEVLEEQRNRPDGLFGQIAIELGFIDDAAVDRYLNQKTNDASGG